MNKNVCRHLRTKSMYVMANPDDALAGTDSNGGEPSSPCWCNLTQTVAGPDDRPVSVRQCNSDRACFDS